MAEAAELVRKKHQEREEAKLLEKIDREQQEEEERQKRLQEEIKMRHRDFEERQKRLENERQRKEDEELKMLEKMRERNTKLERFKKDIEVAYSNRNVDALDHLMEDILDDEFLTGCLKDHVETYLEKIEKEKKAILSLSKALVTLDKDLMKSLLNDVDSSAYTQSSDIESLILEARRMCYAVSDQEFFALKFREAFKQSDVDMCSEMLPRARDMGIDESEVRMVSMWLAQEKTGSMRTMRVRTISAVLEEKELQNLRDYFSRIQGAFPLKFHSLIRTTKDYARNKLSKSKYEKQMLIWQEVRHETFYY